MQDYKDGKMINATLLKQFIDIYCVLHMILRYILQSVQCVIVHCPAQFWGPSHVHQLAIAQARHGNLWLSHGVRCGPLPSEQRFQTEGPCEWIWHVGPGIISAQLRPRHLVNLRLNQGWYQEVSSYSKEMEQQWMNILYNISLVLPSLGIDIF